MKTIGQRELRNDNARVIRSVEEGESFLVTKNGTPVAVLRPAEASETSPALPLARPASNRVDYRDWPRVTSTLPSEELLDELRGER
ncbi:MAG: type II toxin-antitoxin system prevent-host-death family antitoxin [Nocardioides sp.]|uniref:type II toxin-antitoxin system Phd/YefM family antitoxin n=1 Tax=Nocardioides sp. TaxID=35761 RepID=UPI0039E4F7A8